MPRVSQNKKTKKVGVSLCERSREHLGQWAKNGIQKPMAFFSCIRLTHLYFRKFKTDYASRSNCQSVQFIMPLAVLERLDQLADRWGKSRSETADISILNVAKMVKEGEEIPLWTVMPLHTPRRPELKTGTKFKQSRPLAPLPQEVIDAIPPIHKEDTALIKSFQKLAAQTDESFAIELAKSVTPTNANDYADVILTLDRNGMLVAEAKEAVRNANGGIIPAKGYMDKEVKEFFKIWQKFNKALPNEKNRSQLEKEKLDFKRYQDWISTQA